MQIGPYRLITQLSVPFLGCVPRECPVCPLCVCLFKFSPRPRKYCRKAPSQTPLSSSTRRSRTTWPPAQPQRMPKRLQTLREQRLAARLGNPAAQRQPAPLIAPQSMKRPQQGGQGRVSPGGVLSGTGGSDTLVLPRAASPTSISTTAEKDTYSTSASENDRFTRETAGMDRPHPLQPQPSINPPGEESMADAKPYTISKQVVWEAYPRKRLGELLRSVLPLGVDPVLRHLDASWFAGHAGSTSGSAVTSPTQPTGWVGWHEIPICSFSGRSG